jgi:hypothetical protein
MCLPWGCASRGDVASPEIKDLTRIFAHLARTCKIHEIHESLLFYLCQFVSIRGLYTCWACPGWPVRVRFLQCVSSFGRVGFEKKRKNSPHKRWQSDRLNMSHFFVISVQKVRHFEYIVIFLFVKFGLKSNCNRLVLVPLFRNYSAYATEVAARGLSAAMSAYADRPRRWTTTRIVHAGGRPALAPQVRFQSKLRGSSTQVDDRL